MSPCDACKFCVEDVAMNSVEACACLHFVGSFHERTCLYTEPWLCRDNGMRHALFCEQP